MYHKEAVISITWISGRIPFPKMAAKMEMDVKALNTLDFGDDSKV